MLAAATVHFPYITAFPDRAPPQDRETTLAGFARLGRAFLDDGVDTLIAFTSEHIVNLEPRHASPFVIGVGEDHKAFPEPHFNLEPITRRGDPDFAADLIRALYADGFDPTHSNELLFDHGTTLPLALMNMPPSVALVPIIINSIFQPLPTLERCRAFGAAIRKAVDGSGCGRRIGFLATGGISHTVGAPRPERNDPAFDQHFIGAVSRGDFDAIHAISDAQMDSVGNGTHEIRNWVALAGAMHPQRPEVVTSLPYVTGWNSGVHHLLWDAA